MIRFLTRFVDLRYVIVLQIEEGRQVEQAFLCEAETRSRRAGTFPPAARVAVSATAPTPVDFPNADLRPVEIALRENRGSAPRPHRHGGNETLAFRINGRYL